MADWVAKELATVRLGDARRESRLKRMVSTMAYHPGGSIPQTFATHAEATAAYRLLHSDAVDPGAILAATAAATTARCRGQELVLALQDTTSFTFTGHAATRGLGPLNGRAQGLLMHSVLAVTPAGVPLGLIDQTVWARDPAGPRTRDQWRQRPFVAKESQRWVTSLRAVHTRLGGQTRVLSIADREADIYEVFAEPRPAGCDLLLRNANNRRLLAGPQAHLWARLASLPPAGTVTLALPRRAQEGPRATRLAVRFEAVVLHPPARRVGGAALAPVPLTAVEARECDPPAGKAPIVWVLLTTLPVADLSAAVQCVTYYSRRWLIERYHFALKSGGCRFEDSQLRDVAALTRLLALDCLVAWRLLWLTYLSRVDGAQPCTAAFTDLEWRVLHQAVGALDPLFLRHNPHDASGGQPPPLRTAVRWLGKLGGFLGRPGDGEPGVKVLWTGLTRLQNIVLGVMLAKHSEDLCNG